MRSGERAGRARDAHAPVAAGDLGAVRLVATDLDGTLLGPDGQVSRRTAEAIRSVRAAGVEVVPITARPPHATWYLTDPVGLTGLGGCANGAMVVDLGRRLTVWVDVLAATVTARLVEQLRAAVPGVLLAVDSPDCFLHEPGFLEPHQTWDEEMRVVDDILGEVEEGVVKLIARRPGWTAERLIASVEALLAEEAHATSSGSDWVDLSAFGVTKATGLTRICDMLGVPLSATVACGDAPNDLAMIAAAGLGCAMANAHPDVIAAAGRVLPSNGEDGVASLLEEIAGARRAR